jgi:hypothetical protein
MSNLTEQINRIKEMMIIQEAEEIKDEVFAEKRLKGATKIADTTLKAGGLSLLTYKLPNNINKSFKVLYNYLEKLEPIKIKIFNSSTIKRYFT